MERRNRSAVRISYSTKMEYVKDDIRPVPCLHHHEWWKRKVKALQRITDPVQKPRDPFQRTSKTKANSSIWISLVHRGNRLKQHLSGYWIFLFSPPLESFFTSSIFTRVNINSRKTCAVMGGYRDIFRNELKFQRDRKRVKKWKAGHLLGILPDRTYARLDRVKFAITCDHPYRSRGIESRVKAGISGLPEKFHPREEKYCSPRVNFLGI